MRTERVPDDEVVISADRGLEIPLSERLRSTWPLVVAWTRRDLRARYRQSVLRSWWSFIQPVTILVIYGTVFTAVLDVTVEEAPYLVFAWAGIVPFTFFSSSLGQGVGSIQQAGPIISRMAFPRDVIPLSVVTGAAVDLLIMTGVLVALAWVQVGPPSIHLLGLIPVGVVLVCWTTAVTVATAAITVFRRDLRFAVPLALQVIFIVTPVMYPASLIADWAGWVNVVNPLTVVIEGTRDATYRSEWPDPLVLGAQFLGALLALALAFRLFRRLEPRMSDHV
ncbi:MAG: ABC transporter permease [Microthrixaceae bacterium]